MKLGVIGLGYRMAAVLECLVKADPDIQVVACVDPSPAGAPGLSRARIGIGTMYDTPDRMLAAETLDLLLVGSPNHLHLEHVRAGLRAGVRVFTEKPVVIDENQTFELAALLREFGSDRVLVGLVLRYASLYKDLRAAQRAGHLGAIASIEATEHIAPYHGAFFMRDWRRYQRFAGPYILEKCCHDLDIYASVVGARAMTVASFGGRKSFIPENAPGHLSNAEREMYHRKPSGWMASDHVFDGDADIIDYQTALIEYANGATMAFHANLNVPDQFRRFCIVGSNGMAEGDFIRNYFRVHDARNGEKILETSYAGHEHNHYGADDQMAFDLIDHFRTGTPLPVGVLDALEAGLTAIKIDEARRTRRLVDLTESWQRFDDALGSAACRAEGGSV
ncbi:Gfo/Idh/MocA family protein [Microvirga lotononidis]|uniref:Putative dehydrogenase n=1 Tax=Microvirga lotononidis TaxID=864069 RepID=I4YRM8_9HYPH|nr:Gfo/Idh/MocA family oxidoreductase [Microvirga lotononidis]EIM26620.1 putative dehydrogenase [Microvirga lotononidis]WQO31295.1 Gfo/Idh/MocA family oxidoreductase [Microvirga lotononidis]